LAQTRLFQHPAAQEKTLKGGKGKANTALLPQAAFLEVDFEPRSRSGNFAEGTVL